MVEESKEKVGDGQGDAAYHLSFEAHLHSGLGRRGDLAGRRRPLDEPLHRGKVALVDQFFDIAVRNIRTASIALVGVILLL